jgi:predicted amidohydrolase
VNVFKIAALQMVSGPEVEANLKAAAALIGEAAAQGAKLAALPEYFCIMGLRDTDKVAAREQDGRGPIQDFLAEAAAKHGIWVAGGSVPLSCDDPGKVRNSMLVYDDKGRRVARYDKIHLFGFEMGEERYREAATIEPGAEPVAIDSPFGRLGLSICYDVRFPELYRGLGADIILVPSAFTATTGRAHWEVLLRARAVENLAYVLAPAQGGRHASGRETFGHSMIVDPWGKILASLERGPGVVLAEIDLAYLRKMRGSLPALTHRVL